MTIGPWIKPICALALLGVVLTGCARKGDLETPGQATVTTGSGEETSAPATRERPFILDGLLE